MTWPRITRYTFGSLDPTRSHISVELTCEAGQGPHKPPHDWWAVRDGRDRCLNRDGEWEWEPLPSSREDDFLARCRFTVDDALRLARKEWARQTGPSRSHHVGPGEGVDLHDWSSRAPTEGTQRADN